MEAERERERERERGGERQRDSETEGQSHRQTGTQDRPTKQDGYYPTGTSVFLLFATKQSERLHSSRSLLKIMLCSCRKRENGMLTSKVSKA